LPDIRFRDLRYTAASLMLKHGIPVIIVTRRLGPTKPSITLDIYGHLIPGIQEEAAQLMDELITPVEYQQLHPTAPNCTRSAPDFTTRRAHPPYLAHINKKPLYLGAF
jgi:integrase